MTFYDKQGNPIAYLDDEIHIFLFTGQPVAYIEADSVYNFNGKQLGWFEDGWIIDLNGSRVFFTEISYGGPIKPIKHFKPIKSVRQLKPIKSIREIRKIKRIKLLAWSVLSSINFFYQ